MKKTLIDTYRSLSYNLRTLLFFELIYRVIGLLVIFPIAQGLFQLSIRLSGFTYVTNMLLFTYLTRPSTIIILVLMLLIVSIYIVIEMIFLSLIFDYGYHQKDITIKELITLGFKRVYDVVKKYRLRVLGPALLFFLSVQLMHLVGIASTLEIPEELLVEINKNIWLQVAFYGVAILGVALFIETIFSLHFYTIENLSTKTAFKESRKMLKKRRVEMFFEFILVNMTVNLILYLFYAGLVLIVGLFVSITRGQVYALGIILTVFYTLYVIVGFFATIILVPINYALISSWYYEGRERLGLFPTIVNRRKKQKFITWKSKKVKVITISTAVILLTMNLISVFAVINTPKVQLQLFNYAEIIAHRGASWDAPENTMSAIELAIYQQADAVEIDVRETSDLVPILMHDTTLGRTTNDPNNRRVSDVSLAQMKLLDAGSWFSPEFEGEQIPTLEEALQVIAGKTKLFLELKTYSRSLELNSVALVEAYQMINDTVFLSFSREQIRRLKQINPEVQTLLLISTFYGDAEALARARDIDAYGLSEFFFLRNPEFVDLVHQQNKKIYVWTVNSDNAIRNVANRDADGIITDRPLPAREIVYARNTPDILLEILRRLFRPT